MWGITPTESLDYAEWVRKPARTHEILAELQIEPRRVFSYACGCHCVNVALTQQDVGLTLEFNLGSIFGFKEHPVTHFEQADVGSCSHNLGPLKPPPDLRGSRDHDAAT